MLYYTVQSSSANKIVINDCDLISFEKRHSADILLQKHLGLVFIRIVQYLIIFKSGVLLSLLSVCV